MADGALIALLLLQAASAPTAAPAKPPTTAPVPAKPDMFGTVRSVVVEAIRDCGRNKEGELLVCSPDRGFSEVDRSRLKKLEKPKPIDNGSPIQITVSSGDTPPQPAYPGKP